MEPSHAATRPRVGRPFRRRVGGAGALGCAAVLVALTLVPAGGGAALAISRAPPPSATSALGHAPGLSPATAPPLPRPASPNRGSDGGGALVRADLSEPIWWNVTAASVTPLPIFEFTQGTFDAKDGYVLVYGGDNYTYSLNQTWAYRTGNWSELAPTGNPGPLSGPAMAYDASDGYVVMYGGEPDFSPNAGNNLTWIYVNGTWTSYALHPSPWPMVAASMAYDPVLGGVVLFGGENDSNNGQAFNQLWLYKGGAWSQVPANAPPPARWQAQLTYDPIHRELVLYGGVSALGATLGDTWTFSNGSWTHLPTTGSLVPALSDAAMDFDPDLMGVTLTAGLTATFDYSYSTWVFNGTMWNALATAGAPHAHDAGIGVYDPPDHELVLAGGNPSGAQTDVLTLPISVTATEAPTEADVGESLEFVAAASGGTPPHAYVWNWGDGSVGNESAVAYHAYGAAGNFSVGVTASGPSGEEAVWTGTIEVRRGLSIQVRSDLPGIDTNVSNTFTAAALGGWGGYVYQWSLGAGVSATGSQFMVAFPTPGPVQVQVVATDTAGGTGERNFPVLVNATPSATILGPLDTEQGVSANYTALVVGGTAPFIDNWTFGDGTLRTGPEVSHASDARGIEPARLTVMDADGVSASTEVNLSIEPSVAGRILGPLSAAPGARVQFSANITGGIGPYSEIWMFPGGVEENGTTVAYTFQGTGTEPVRLTILDGAGGTTHREVNITVAASSIAPLGGSIGGVPLLLVLGVVLVVAVAVGLLAMRGRRSGPSD
jgi:hypothetical protein